MTDAETKFRKQLAAKDYDELKELLKECTEAEQFYKCGLIQAQIDTIIENAEKEKVIT